MGFKTYECINCGHSAWSLREVDRCGRCGSIAVCVSKGDNNGVKVDQRPI